MVKILLLNFERSRQCANSALIELNPIESRFKLSLDWFYLLIEGFKRDSDTLQKKMLESKWANKKKNETIPRSSDQWLPQKIR